MKLSYVIAARNQRDRLLKTIETLEESAALPRHMWEVVVVDNSSDDDTVCALSHEHRHVKVIRCEEDEGTPGRNRGLKAASGRFVCFLNPDSTPAGDAVTKSLDYLARHTRVAAVTGRLLSQDGSGQAPALPAVATGGATIYRASTLKQVGGFAPEFFDQAEEYELSFRLWGAGHRIDRFEDIVYSCHHVPVGPRASLAQKLRLRNLLIVIERYVPRPLRQAYRRDITRRYAALAMADGNPDALRAALREARVWARRETGVGRKTLGGPAIEAIFEIERQAKLVAGWAKREHISRVAIADFGLNLHATWQACRRAGLDVRCVVEPQKEYAGLSYLGAPIVGDDAAGDVQGIVLSTINPSRVAKRSSDLAAKFAVPVLPLWEGKWIDAPAGRPKSVENQGQSGGENPTPVRNVA